MNIDITTDELYRIVCQKIDSNSVIKDTGKCKCNCNYIIICRKLDQN